MYIHAVTVCYIPADTDPELKQLSVLPEAVFPYLDQTLEWADIVKIAEDMVDWEEHLVLPLELSEVDVNDIKYDRKPELQR